MGNLKFPHFFWSFVYQSKSTGKYKLTDKQKPKKVREIQITQILRVINTISYILCALRFIKICKNMQSFNRMFGKNQLVEIPFAAVP